jgi:hypothetical protein
VLKNRSTVEQQLPLKIMSTPPAGTPTTSSANDHSIPAPPVPSIVTPGDGVVDSLFSLKRMNKLMRVLRKTSAEHYLVLRDLVTHRALLATLRATADGEPSTKKRRVSILGSGVDHETLQTSI